MERLSEMSAIITALVPQALNDSNATGRYIKMAKGFRLRAVLLHGAAAATKTGKIELLQAQDIAATGAKAITDRDGNAVTATFTANSLVNEATIALASVANTDIVTVNGIDFTKAAANDFAAREFADAAGLVLCINHATYGVPHVIASAVTTTVTVRANPEGDATVTVGKTEVAGTITLATTVALAFVDIPVGLLDLANDFYYVAAKVTTTANSVVAALFDLYPARWTPTQAVGASDLTA